MGSEQPTVQTLQVVIISESPTSQLIYKKSVTSLGEAVQVHSFMLATGALRWLLLNPADLIICDLWMLDLSGLELLRVLRSRAATRDVPVLALTADAKDETWRLALEAGATDCVTVPLRHYELREKLEALLGL